MCKLYNCSLGFLKLQLYENDSSPKYHTDILRYKVFADKLFCGKKYFADKVFCGKKYFADKRKQEDYH